MDRQLRYDESSEIASKRERRVNDLLHMLNSFLETQEYAEETKRARGERDED
jgi:hypothetical protein